MPLSTTTRPSQRQRFSINSTEAVPDSLWFASDFLLGAGTVILQPETGRVVLLYNPEWRFWFLPKGRKDVGESLEQTALREAYEESGYRVEFLPLKIPTRAPKAPIPNDTTTLSDEPRPIAAPSHFNTEPIYISTHTFKASPRHDAGEYITFWFVAFIGPDAIHEENTGMPDEKHFETHLLSPEEAERNLEETGSHTEAIVVRAAHALWLSAAAMQHT